MRTEMGTRSCPSFVALVRVLPRKLSAPERFVCDPITPTTTHAKNDLGERSRALILSYGPAEEPARPHFVALTAFGLAPSS
jgi:hypothetical protein